MRMLGGFHGQSARGQLATITILLALGAGCSRANVESMNHMNQGVVLATQKQYVEAVQQLERAAAIDSSNDQAFFNLAIVHMEMRKFERAKDDLTRAIAVSPENALTKRSSAPC